MEGLGIDSKGIRRDVYDFDYVATNRKRLRKRSEKDIPDGKAEAPATAQRIQYLGTFNKTNGAGHAESLERNLYKPECQGPNLSNSKIKQF